MGVYRLLRANGAEKSPWIDGGEPNMDLQKTGNFGSFREVAKQNMARLRHSGKIAICRLNLQQKGFFYRFLGVWTVQEY